MYLGSKVGVDMPSDLLARLGYRMGDLYRDSIVLTEWNLAHLLEELAHSCIRGTGIPQTGGLQMGRSIEQLNSYRSERNAACSRRTTSQEEKEVQKETVDHQGKV